MELKGSLPDWQVPATCPYPEPARSSPYSHVRSTTPRRSILMFSSHLSLDVSRGLFPAVFPTKTLYTPLHFPILATCAALLVFSILSPEQYWAKRSLSFSLCSFLHFLVTSFHLGPNILLNTLFSNTLSLRFSFSVSDQVLHTYKKQEKLYFCVSQTLNFLK